MCMNSMFIMACNSITQSEITTDVRYLAWQDDNYLWASTFNKLIRWNVETEESKVFKNISGKLFVDSENTLWVFDEGVIERFDGQVWKRFEAGKDFADGGVFSFTEAEGYIWVGTSGLSRYSQQNETWEVLFDTPPGPSPTPVPKNTMIVEELLEGVHSIVLAEKGAMWLGTSKGLTYWKDDIQQTWSNNILNSDGVRCLLDASDGEVWVCTDSGVGRWNKEQWADFLKAPDDRKELFQGKNQEIWVTDRQIGVARWNGTLWQNWTSTLELNYPPDRNSLLGAHSLIVSTTDANVWVVTRGIRRWDGQRWRTYTTNDGLNSNSVNTLIQDPTGTLWTGTREGINYYDSDTARWYPFPEK